MLRVSAILALAAAPALGQPALTIDRAGYEDRLRAMWLGQCIANWTGLRTEGARIEPPFFTDADWGTTPPGRPTIEFVLNQDPWLADDDTDIEYVYLHLMHQHGRSLLSGPEIAAGWLAHMDPDYIWVSNRRAYDLMQGGVIPPASGMGGANGFFNSIDAQLTTEFFGALCPGMPEEALRYAELPIRTSADGFAVHAAQFFAVLYALGPRVDPGLSGREKALWLVREARRWLPDSSKSADIVDFVLADFEANPDADNWELTRDRIYDRYQLNSGAHGFWYRGWTESSVNFACGVMCLLYGHGDYTRTVRIGTLSGWDSDNGTATMGGLLGLMLGYDALTAQFPGHTFSDRYDIERTRDNLPDYLPADPAAQDTFSLMAARMMPLIDANIVAAGGSVEGAQWRLPPAVATRRRASAAPGEREWRRSANNLVREAGGAVSVSSSAASPNPTWPPWTNGTPALENIANGYPQDPAGRDQVDHLYWYYTSEGSGTAPGSTVTLTVEYDRPVEMHTVRFIEGQHFGDPASPVPPPAVHGGWFENVTLEVRVNGAWVTPAAAASEALDPARPFQVIDYVIMGGPVEASGVRLSGVAGGTGAFVTCCEIDALGAPIPIVRMNRVRGGR